MRKFRIGAHEIGDSNPCFIIAEAGVNHNGRIDLAEQLVDAAAAVGADAVKFQTYKTSELILPNISKAPYQKRTTDMNEEQEQMLKSLEIDELFHQKIFHPQNTLEACKFQLGEIWGEGYIDLLPLGFICHLPQTSHRCRTTSKDREDELQ